MGQRQPFFTIGHSTRPTDEFIDLLRHAEVRLVVDVRKMPRSRTNPQYNGDVFAETLATAQIGYEYVEALGGLRKRERSVAAEVNGLWRNRSFHNYADYALSDEFKAGLADLRRLGHDRTCAIMCAEAVWWRCHRRIIADHLIAAGEEVFHILAGDRIEPARQTPGATLQAGTLTYPAETTG